jgi:membrane protein DedA with SNARE-associated domain
VFLVAFAESMALIGVLVPGVVLMFGFGALIGTGVLPFWPVVSAAILGAIAGDGLSYWLGKHYQQQISGLWPLSRHPEMLANGRAFFQRHGGKSVLLGRFFGPVRAVIPLVAGMLRMPSGRFLLSNIASALAWGPIYLLPGMVFGASMELAAEVALRLALLFVLSLMTIWLVVVALRHLYRVGRWQLTRLCGHWPCPSWLAWSIGALGSLLAGIGLLSGMLLASGFPLPPQLPLAARTAAPPVQHIAPDRWWREGAAETGEVRRDLRLIGDHPLNLQYAGKLPDLARQLEPAGWRAGIRLSPTSALRWLAPDQPIASQPLLPQVHGNRFNDLALVKPFDAHSRLVLRLWSSNLSLENGEADIWVGNISHQKTRRIASLAQYAITDKAHYSNALKYFAEQLEQGQTGLQWTLRDDWLLLRQAPQSAALRWSPTADD